MLLLYGLFCFFSSHTCAKSQGTRLLPLLRLASEVKPSAGSEDWPAVAGGLHHLTSRALSPDRPMARATVKCSRPGSRRRESWRRAWGHQKGRAGRVR